MRRVVVLAISLALVALSLPLAARAEEPACEWLAGDFHVHTVYSHDTYGGPDDEGTGTEEFYTLGWTPGQQGAIAESRDLDFIAITDHNNMDGFEHRHTDASGVHPYESGWGRQDQIPGGDPLVWIPDYENSFSGHAQMHGATHVYDDHNDPVYAAQLLHEDGGAFQINHPADMGWHDDSGEYLYPGFAPDALELWNIGVWLYEPPAPATNNHEFPVTMYDEFLDQGFRVAATGGSDTHWRSTTAAQGVGQPTTWVCAADRTSEAIVNAVKANRTMISHQPPAHMGAVAYLYADGDGDGSFESMIGDTATIGPDTTLRADVEGAEGAQLRLVTNNGHELANVTVTNFNFSQTFTVPEDATWVRAEVLYQDGREARRLAQPLCDVSEQVYQGIGLSDEENFYCENRLAMVAMTSPVYFEQESFDPTTTLTYTGATQSKSGNEIDLAATLHDSAGAPLAGQPVVFTFQGRSYNATTDTNGRALTQALVRGGPGTSEVVSQFDGTELYESSTDIDVITVLKGRKVPPASSN